MMPFRAVYLLVAFCQLPWVVVGADALFDETKRVTLFAFDEVSIPFSQNLRLEMRRPERHPGNPVLRRGAPGSPDAYGVQFYGSVIREGGKFRMWYVAFDDDVANPVASERWRAAYAESADGVTWTKPNLGLVEYRGSKDNNLVLTDPAPLGFVNLKVLADPGDPDPSRRYKMSTHIYFRHHTRLGSLAPFTSEDGLRWKLVRDGVTPVKAELKMEDLFLPAFHFEPCGGLYLWQGQYVINGQNAMQAARPYHGRVVRTFRSPDFVNWSTTSGIAFVREPQHTLLGPGRSREGEQNHEGIAVWNRGNVLLGVTGRWHGGAEWKDVTVDLGFVVSNDGYSFREPLHEWTFLERGPDGAWDQGGLLQGQGFENVGDQTFLYYGAWDPRHWVDTPERGGVGIATLPRDRFGALVVDETAQGPGDYQLPEIVSEFVTSPVSVAVKAGENPRIFVNAEGLGDEAWLRIELLDSMERPLSGYAGEAAAMVRQSGFQAPVNWQAISERRELPEKVRLRVIYEGAKKTAIRLSAIYLDGES
ncbi:MAG: hypothetical protein KDM64_06795 [Verrucomicrobiae bacterium]|nr:hypothetical protein [Verrucomicrobiae bacterium]